QLEYRVITTTSEQPLAPDFWLDHSFDATGVVSEERFSLDLPSDSRVRTKFSSATQPDATPSPSQDSRSVYTWTRKSKPVQPNGQTATTEPDIQVSTFSSWNELADRVGQRLIPSQRQTLNLREKAVSISPDTPDTMLRAERLYDYVSQKIRTVDLPVG